MFFPRAFFVAMPLAFAAVAHADTKSEQAAAELLHRKLAKEHPEDKALLDAVKGRDIVVVQGGMDRIEDVLTAAKIPFTRIFPSQVAQHELRSNMIVMVNCPGEMPRAGAARIERFVRAGGLLYTTDWALENLVARIFPRTIKFNGQVTGDELVGVEIDKASENLMSRMLLNQGSKPQWWLEGSSYPIRILDKDRVEVLAHSKVMGKRYGASPVVVRFKWEDGEVIHVVSHFYRQLATKGPRVAVKDARIDGLSDAELADFKKSAAATAALGDVESSYAFQSMTGQLVTGKQRRNVELEKLYDRTVSKDAVISTTPAEGGPAAAPVAAGTRMKILKQSKGRAQVRDELGNEGWIDEAQLIAK